ncbi:hypothetical protein CCR75_001654 [Bremia lactucae]|uniref:FHA domain-containing protein n=1 Tax=Bremia lactucae TaxID=4779 RepID=A0A976IFT5_BRELC|nr:hypothetical protein CCR75_001654 [Bremia lactucae]
MPSTSTCKTVLRVGRPPDNYNPPQHKEDGYFLPSANGIVLGTGWQATYKLQRSSKADEAHGTLERTSKRGIWVYSDHSNHGTLVNNKVKVHHDAVVVHHGDQLQLGQMKIFLCLEMGTFLTPLEAQKVDVIDHVGPVKEIHQTIEEPTRLAQRRASTPSSPAALMSKDQQKKQRLPPIDTMNLNQVVHKGSVATHSIVAPFANTAVPITSPKWALDRPQLQRFGHEIENVVAEAKGSCSLPPLEYSNSPMVSPSSIKTRIRHDSFQESPQSAFTHIPAPIKTPPGRLTARRDDLRIQVSKKMAAAAPRVSRNTIIPTVVHLPLTPASPIALRDIRNQQESLKTILQHKHDEEKVLKQQQEEWMRTNTFHPNDHCRHVSDSLKALPLNLKDQGLGDTKDEAWVLKAPVLLRTISLGGAEPSIMTPTFTARNDNTTDRLQHNKLKNRRKTTPLVLNLDQLRQLERETMCVENKLKVYSSTESIASTASTVITCHRRITSSVSSESARSVDLCDFVGYEDDPEDMTTSYRMADFEDSDELVGHAREQQTSAFKSTCLPRASSLYGSLSPLLSSNSSDTRFGSPRRCRSKTYTASRSSNIHDLIAEGDASLRSSRVWNFKKEYVK